MIIRTLITAVLTAFALPLTLRYNMHMLQLNGYKNDEHLRWMKKNIRMQWILLFLMALGLLRVFFAPAALDILVWLTLLVTALVYRQMKLMATKKKLVWTPRVKRMTVTILLLGALLLIGGMLLAAHSYVASGAGNLAVGKVRDIREGLLDGVADTFVGEPDHILEGHGEVCAGDHGIVLELDGVLLALGVEGAEAFAGGVLPVLEGERHHGAGVELDVLETAVLRDDGSDAGSGPTSHRGDDVDVLIVADERAEVVLPGEGDLGGADEVTAGGFLGKDYGVVGLCTDDTSSVGVDGDDVGNAVALHKHGGDGCSGSADADHCGTAFAGDFGRGSAHFNPILFFVLSGLKVC